MSSTSPISAVAVCVIAGTVAWLFTNAAAPTSRRMDSAVARAHLDRRLRENHARAEEMLAALRRRIWNPVRDAKIRTAEITISVKHNEKHGTYRARFDGTKALDEQVSVETLEEEPGVHPDAAWQVKQWADLAFLGAYQEVVNPLPADLYALTKTTSGQSVVTTPEFRLAPQTSYRFDARGLVEIRGTVRDRGKTRKWKYGWFDWKTGAVLTGWSEEMDNVPGVAEANFEYGKRQEFPALSRVILRVWTAASGGTGDRFEATFEWGALVKE